MGKYRKYFKEELYEESEEDRLRKHRARKGARITKDGLITSRCLGFHGEEWYLFKSEKYWNYNLNKYMPINRLCPKCTADNDAGCLIENWRGIKKKLKEIEARMGEEDGIA